MLTPKESAALTKAVAGVMRDYVGTVLAPVLGRLASVEQRSNADLCERIAVLEHRLVAAESRAMLPGPKGDPGPPGSSAPASDVLDLMAALEKRVVAAETRALTPGPKGDAGERGERGPQGDKGADGLAGQDGAPGVPGSVGPEGPSGARGEQGDTGTPGARGPAGADGMPGKAGSTGPVGEKGMDGAHGRDGRDGLPGTPGPIGEKGLDGKDGARGADGKDGRDGTLEHLKMKFDGERTLTFCFKNGDPIEGGVLTLPAVIYRGVYVEGKAYEAGDSVTHGGAVWIAKTSTAVKPDEHVADGRRDWTLAVRRGRDGKQGPTGLKGFDGKDGPPGPRAYS